MQADFETGVRPHRGADEPLVKKKDGEIGRFNPAQFNGVQSVPLDCSPALNLIGVHPALIAFANAALGTDDVHLYQCQAWAKFTGDADYDQPFHCDFVNHTLTAPSDDDALNSVTYHLLFQRRHRGARPDPLRHPAGQPEGRRPRGDADRRSGAAGRSCKPLRALGAPGRPARLFVYGIDIWHRGTNLTAPGGHRYVMTVLQGARSNTAINSHAWPIQHTKPWRIIFEHATPEQLACSACSRPAIRSGPRPRWRRAQARYPNWDMTLWREAMQQRQKAPAI